MLKRCPEPADLLLLALDGGGGAQPSLSRHVAGCVACGAEVRRLRWTAEWMHVIPAAATGLIGECLDELAITEIAGGTPKGLHDERIAHLSTCSACRLQVAAVASLLSEPAIAKEIDRFRSTQPTPAIGRQRLMRAGVVAALAAGVLFAMLLPARANDPAASPTRDAAAALRDETVTTTAPPTLLAPLGHVVAADTLRWTSVPTANRYRAVLFSSDGSVLLETETADTAAAIPSGRVRPDARYLWKVEARTGWGRWVASDLLEFTISGRRSGR